MMNDYYHKKATSSKLSKLDSQISFKIIFLGDSNTGKTSIINHANCSNDKSVRPTLNFDYHTMIHEFESWIVKLQIWDTCGQEKFRALVKNFYKNTDLAVLVYSIDNVTSFNNIDVWLKDLRSLAKSDLAVVLVGNKSDIEDRRQVTQKMVEDYKERNSIQLAMEVSAESGVGIKSLFVQSAFILSEMYFSARSVIESETIISEDRILLHDKKPEFNLSHIQSTTFQSAKRKKHNCCN